MARKLTPRIVTADEVSDILTPSEAPAPRLSRRPAPARLRTRANFADVILSLWTEAEENFLAIGRYLNHARTVLEHGEFMAMVDRDLPFRYSTANRLMKVAAAIDDGLLPTDSLPLSYATVYEMVLLNPQEREQAAAQGLFRPDVRRQDIIAFKKHLRAAALPDLAAERAELARLEAERARIDARIAELREKLRTA